MAPKAAGCILSVSRSQVVLIHDSGVDFCGFYLDSPSYLIYPSGVFFFPVPALKDLVRGKDDSGLTNTTML